MIYLPKHFANTMKFATAAALVVSAATAKDLSLTWKDCGDASTKTKITGFSPSSITLGQKTIMTGTGDLSEAVDGATFDLTMTGALGQLLHCSGDASVSKTCSLPLGTGSLTFEAMKFPIAVGNVPVNVDIDLSSKLPTALAKTKTITKATAKNGDKLFCIEIDSASASSEQDEIQSLPSGLELEGPSAQGGNLKLDWNDCGDSSYHAKVQSLSPGTLPIGKKTTVTGSGNVDEQVTGGTFTITAKYGITEHYTGDVCASKVFHLPLGLGTITWDGLKCPMAKGSVSVGVDVQLASAIPAKLAKGTIEIKASDASKQNLICVDIKTSAAEQKSQIDAPLQCKMASSGRLPYGADCVTWDRGSRVPLSTYCCADGLVCTSAASRHRDPCGGTIFPGESCSCTHGSDAEQTIVV